MSERKLSAAQMKMLRAMADGAVLYCSTVLAKRWWLRWPDDSTTHVHGQSADNLLLAGALKRAATYHPSFYSLAHSMSAAGRAALSIKETE